MKAVVAWFVAVVLLCACEGACSKRQKSEEFAALEGAYQSGVLTRDEYEAKKAALESQASALAALDEAYRSGVLTQDEYRVRKERLDAKVVDLAKLEKAFRAGVLSKDEYLTKKAALFAPSTPAASMPAPPAQPLPQPSARVDAPPVPERSASAPQPSAVPDRHRPATSLPPAMAKPKLRVQAVFDTTMGNMLAYRFLVPQEWKAGGRTDWNYREGYEPLRIHTRAEAPDGSAWYEDYPQELFFWGDHDTPASTSVFGGIHHRNITIQEAMTRYVIARYRGRSANLRILGYRPVNGLGQALGKPDYKGEGICVRIRYDLDNQPVDEEFYAMMTPVVTIPYTGPQGTWYEFHREMGLVHSFGAKSGKLESMRPILGSIAPSLRGEKAWQNRVRDVTTQINNEYSRQLQIANDRGRAAVEMSRIISANNDQMIRNMDAQRAAGNLASSRASNNPSSGGFERHTDDFDQYMRGTEHVVDAWGQVSDQPNQYNYHWTDGFGNFVHSNDASYDPNAHSPTRFEQTRPGR